MSNVIRFLVAILLTLAIWYILHAIWLNYSHSRRARQWGCKPAFIRPYRLPLGIDILKRYIDANDQNNLMNDDMALFQELGQRATWNQQILGTWQHATVDPKNIQAILATQFKDFELGPLRRDVFDPLLGTGIFTVDGKEWEHSRSILRPQFTRGQVSDLELEETHVQNLFDRMPSQSDLWTDKVNLGPLFFNFTLDSATEFLFGESVNSQRLHGGAVDDKTPNLEKTTEPAWSSFGQYFDEANAAAMVRFRLLDLYFLYNPKSFQNNCRKVHNCVDYFVKLALSGESPALKRKRYIFSHELAKIIKDPKELRSQLLNILLAGRDTTAGLLSFTFYMLARHPEVYDKLRKIVLDQFGSGNKNISFESLKSCTYLQHVISEVLRLEPIVPENDRRAVRNTTLPRGGGPDGQSPVYIREGEQILYNVRIMQRRKDIWGEDAEEFKPDRWIGYKPGWEFLPFNGGPRMCLGQQFALTEAGYVIVRMLQQYDKIESLDHKTLKHRFTVTTSPCEVLVRLHKVRQ